MSNSDSFYDELFAGIEEEVEKQMSAKSGKRRVTSPPASTPASTDNSGDLDLSSLFETHSNTGERSGRSDTAREPIRSTPTPSTANRTWVNPAPTAKPNVPAKQSTPASNRTWVNATAPNKSAPAPVASKTWVNQAPSDRGNRPGSSTVVNPKPNNLASSTMVNPKPNSSGSSTMVNPKQSLPNYEGNIIGDKVGLPLDLDAGTELMTESARYIVMRRLGNAADTGESDVFICSRDNKAYVVKMFRRAMRIKPELINTLKNIDSDLVAKIIDFGTYVNRHFEVYEYYDAGSLADELKVRVFSYEELKTVIIPSLNEGLKAIHSAGILHRDIKPSNILWKNSSKKSTVLIDFGLSSVIRDSSSSANVSTVGGTTGYTAPEVWCDQEKYHIVSDYFSMGIVLYELFCGKTPFKSKEAVAFQITQPSNMPNDLYDLILGLTYIDIRYRDDKNNPNRRWEYEEVKDWLNGNPHPVPGTVNGSFSNAQYDDRTIDPKISFAEHAFDNIDALCRAMGSAWESGLQFLMRGDLVSRLTVARRNNAANQQLWLSQIQDVLNNSNYGSPDQKLFRVIHMLSPKPDYIPCPLGCFESVEELGEQLLAALQSDNARVKTAAENTVRLLVGSQTLTEGSENLTAFMVRKRANRRAIEHMAILDETPYSRLQDHLPTISYELAFLLSNHVELDVGLPDHTVFKSVDEIKAYLARMAKGDFKELYRVCGYFLDGSHTLKPKVYGWMRNQGVDLKEFNI